jgi:hypothetical protein
MHGARIASRMGGVQANRLEGRPQGAAGTVEPDLRRVRREPEGAGRVRRAELLEITQLEHGPMMLRERGDGTPDDGAQLRRGDDLLGRWGAPRPRSARRAHEAEWLLPAAVMLAAPDERRVDDDAMEPGGRLRTMLESSGAPERRYACILDCVMCLVLVPDDPAGHGEQTVVALAEGPPDGAAGFVPRGRLCGVLHSASSRPMR